MSPAIVFALAFAMITCGSPAGTTSKYQTCASRAMTQTAMAACASDYLLRTNIDMSTMYQRLLSKASTQPSAVKNIKNEKIAWTNYRDSLIAAVYPAPNKQSTYGSIYPMEVDLLRVNLELCHISALSVLLQSLESRH